MFRFYRDMYAKFIEESHDEMLISAYRDIEKALLSHAPDEYVRDAVALEFAHDDVQLLYDAAVDAYHAASTDYGKRQASLRIDTYGFFLYLTQPDLPDVPYR